MTGLLLDRLVLIYVVQLSPVTAVLSPVSVSGEILPVLVLLLPVSALFLPVSELFLPVPAIFLGKRECIFVFEFIAATVMNFIKIVAGLVLFVPRFRYVL